MFQLGEKHLGVYVAAVRGHGAAAGLFSKIRLHPLDQRMTKLLGQVESWRSSTG